MVELKPCPFCGGQVEIERGSTSGAMQCVGQSSCLHSGLLIGFALADEAEAIAAWNRRAPTFTAADLEAAFRLGLDMAAGVAYRTCAEIRHVSLGLKSEESIRAITPPADLADRVKGGGE